MPTKRITLKAADNIEGAAEQIIHLLKDTDKGGDVIYLHGWYGWGASAILKDVVRRLRSSLGSGGLEKIIHVDFSQWQSKRALQKAIAKELELAEQVMALFDQCDEEDDFDGVEHSARGAIPHVKLAIMNELIARRLLVVLHNGSGRFIELREVGVPLLGELGKRVLWTSRGGFWTLAHVTSRHYDLMEESAGLSDVAIRFDLSSSSDDDVDAAVVEVKNIMYAEIEEVARYTGVPEPDMSLNIVTECILYMAAIGSDQDISEQRQEEPRRFPRLKRIHLYDLPKLQRICGRRMLAPRLETVKVRGCWRWGLKRLPPAVTQESSSPASSPTTVVDLDCEKEWWNRLEWDGEKAGHCPSHYKPTFSAYYKKKLLRASVLR